MKQGIYNLSKQNSLALTKFLSTLRFPLQGISLAVFPVFPVQWGPCSAYTETLYHRDDALPYIAYVMLIWAAPIPADRWHCSLWP